MISDEAKFVILNCICNKMDIFIVSPNGGNRDEQILYGEANDGIPVYYNSLRLSVEIENLKSNSFQQIIKKINK